MDANETSGLKRRFWNRRKLLVAVAAVGAAVLLVGLLVWFSAPKNELLTEMPTQQSRLRFLGPLRQPVSAAWQRFRRAVLKSSPSGMMGCYQIKRPMHAPVDLGEPLLTNDAGVRVWLLNAETTKEALKRPDFVEIGGRTTASEDQWLPSLLFSPQVPFRARKRYGADTELEVFFSAETLRAASGIQKGSYSLVPTNHPSLRAFGIKVTIPKGSSVLLLGPEVDESRLPLSRFAGLFIPE